MTNSVSYDYKVPITMVVVCVKDRFGVCVRRCVCASVYVFSYIFKSKIYVLLVSGSK